MIQEPQQAEPVRTAPQPQPQQAPVNPGLSAGQEAWEDLGDGTELSLATGEIRQKASAAPLLEEDPDVIKTSDGRFFNKAAKRFVDSPYKGAKPVVSTPQHQATPEQPQDQRQAAPTPANTAPPKRTRKTKAQETGQQPETPPAAAAAPGNGNAGDAPADGPKPIVVPASPKLEALLGGLTPPKN
jgi:hypothetical protein